MMTMCIDFTFFYFFFVSYSFHLLYSTSTDGAGDYYKVTYFLASDGVQVDAVRRQEVGRAKVAGNNVIRQKSFDRRASRG